MPTSEHADALQDKTSQRMFKKYHSAIQGGRNATQNPYQFSQHNNDDILNRKKRIAQNMEQILLLDHIRYRIPCPKAPCLHIPLRTQHCAPLEVQLNK